MTNPLAMPLRYSPAVEKVEPDERETQMGLIEQFEKIQGITYKDGGHGLRGVHAKAHGLLEAELTVADGLPPELAQGLFAQPGSYPVQMRFSTSPGDLLPDDVSTPRGLAIKVHNVEGERMPGTVGDKTQDFVLVVGKAFLAPTPKAFLANLKLLASTTDKLTGGKEILSSILRGTETLVEAVGGESPTIKSLGGYPETHILGESFFSQTPIRYGDYIAKIGLVPVSPELMRLTDAPLDVNGKPDGLRDAVRAFFAGHSGAWELRVQLCTNLDDMPVEDAAKPWPEDKSPYIAVARLTAKTQNSYADERYNAIDSAMSFSPWHCLTAHQPLGGVNRARKPVYEASARFRTQKNGCPMAA
ncbi:MAG TPA: catalase family protein [Rhizomicrobium sp.]